MASTDQVKCVDRLLNNKPARKFNYKTLNMVLLEEIALTS
jgi:hypothetical protein